MDILYLLVPLSVVLVLVILGVFGWALHRGQFEELDHEAERILQDEVESIDSNQDLTQVKPKQSTSFRS